MSPHWLLHSNARSASLDSFQIVTLGRFPLGYAREDER